MIHNYYSIKRRVCQYLWWFLLDNFLWRKMVFWGLHLWEGFYVELEVFRSPPFRRTTFFCPAAKEGKNAPLIFAYAKRIGESRGGYEPSTATAYKRYIFCHQFTIGNRPPFGGEVAQCDHTNCREQVQLGRSKHYFIFCTEGCSN